MYIQQLKGEFEVIEVIHLEEEEEPCPVGAFILRQATRSHMGIVSGWVSTQVLWVLTLDFRLVLDN